MTVERPSPTPPPPHPASVATLSLSSSWVVAAPAELPVQTIWLERFRLVRALGTGASAAVFEVLDLTTQQTLALKVLRSRQPSALARLKAEFRALSQIAHPNLVVMHELFVDEQQRGFFTMDLIEGRPFLDYVRPRAAECCNEARLRHCLEQLARGVQYLHAHGKLHRDLKPANVLVSETGQLTIVDFGLVQASDDHAPRDDAFHGTPAYASPEQLAGEGAGLASDWYAVGGMLYEALTGARPFPGNAPDLLAQCKATSDPLPPSRVTDAPVSEALERICLQLLARDPRARADGRDLLAALGVDERLPEVGPPRACVGRAAELARLERWRSQPAGALLIVGESGMGKSALAQRFLETLRTREGASVFEGRCFVQEALPYNALDGIVEAIARHVRQQPTDVLSQLLPAEAEALLRLFPALERVGLRCMDAAQPSSLDDPSRVRTQAFSGLRQLLAALGERSQLVLFVDDLQWADADSVGLLRELTKPALPGVLVLATYRADLARESAGAHRTCVAELLSTFERLELGPLSARAVTELASRWIASCPLELAREIARESAGHPLLACELIRHVGRATARSRPRSVGLAVALGARLSLLSSAARHCLELICEAGQRLPRSTLLAFDPALQQKALRELRLASVVRETIWDGELQLEPYHDSIRQLVASRLSPARRRGLHALLAWRMRARGGAYLERAVHHHVLAGQPREALVLAERAAAQATRALAFHGAADLLELALSLSDSARVRQRLRLAAAAACARAGRELAAAEHYEAAADEAEPAARVELTLHAVAAFYVSGHSRRGRAVLDRLASEAGVSLKLGPMSRARGITLLVVMLLTGLPYLRSRRSGLLAPQCDASQAATMRVLWSATPAVMLVDGEAACHLAARALAIAARQGERSVYGQALAFHLTLPAFLFGRSSRLVDRRFARARMLAQSSGEFWDDAFVRVMQGGAALCAFDLARATDTCLEVANLPQLRTPFSACVRTSARLLALAALYWQGRVGQLSEVSEAWLEDAIDCGDRRMELACRTMRCCAHLRRDDAEGAEHEIARAKALDVDYVQGAGSEPWWFAGVSLYQGRVQDAVARCAAQREHYGLFAQHSATTRVLWNLTEGTCAFALAEQGIERRDNLRWLERQAKEASRLTTDLSRPIAAQLNASVAVLAGRVGRALPQLERAIASYDRLGMRLHAASLRLALARLAPARGLALERAALAVFAGEKIASPERWARMLAPGLVPAERVGLERPARG